MSHTHVMASGELIEHEHEHDNREHFHFGETRQYGWLTSDCLSPYYPPLPNGEPDPRGHGACEKAIESLRQGLTVYQPLAGQMQALLDEAVGLLGGLELVRPERTAAGGMKYFCQLCHGAGADTPNLVGHMKTVDGKTACVAPSINAFLARDPIAAIVKERK